MAWSNVKLKTPIKKNISPIKVSIVATVTSILIFSGNRNTVIICEISNCLVITVCKIQPQMMTVTDGRTDGQKAIP